MELTNGLVKWVHSLSLKKNREKEGCFVAEGTKCVIDTIEHFTLKYLFVTKEWLAGNRSKFSSVATIASPSQMERMSMLKTAPAVIAVYEIPKLEIPKNIEDDISLVLDGIQDPGNLGTILRIADWFGVRNVFCSKDTVDVYNPKTIQATMGAISRTNVHYVDLIELFKTHNTLPICGTFLDGKNIYKTEIPANGFIVMGNEGKGVTEKIREISDCKLLIPSYPEGIPTSESLNVGMATAIVLSEFRRRQIR